jgi:acetyl esterase/lipase
MSASLSYCFRRRVLYSLGRALLVLVFACAVIPEARARRQEDVPHSLVVRDIIYQHVGDRNLALDLYRPDNRPGPFPVIIWIHGGGWSAGRKEHCPAVMLLPDGYAIASINYRLTRVAPFPAQIEDCKAAVRWVRANAGKYHLDPDKIGAWGHSAGGHLAALLGTSGDVKELEGNGDNLQVSGRVQAVCDVAGPADLVSMYQEVSGKSTELGEKATAAIEALIGGPLEQHKDTAVAASPIHYISKDDPPFLIIQGDEDETVPISQSLEFAKALKAAGVPAVLDVASGRGHGVGGQQFEPTIRTFFSKQLKH